MLPSEGAGKLRDVNYSFQISGVLRGERLLQVKESLGTSLCPCCAVSGRGLAGHGGDPLIDGVQYRSFHSRKRNSQFWKEGKVMGLWFQRSAFQGSPVRRK